MDFYPVYVFEVDNLSSPLRSVEDVVDLVKHLRKEEDESANLPPDPRFIRLGKLLAQQLPDEEGNFWLVRPEVTLSKNKKIWQPELLGMDRTERLLKVLLPLARGLHLGVFDAMFGFYIPPEMKTQPLPKSQEAAQYRAEFDKDFLQFVKEVQAGGSGETKQLTEGSIDKYMDETLIPILAKHGFIRHPKYSCKFERKINGGFQRICAVASSYSYVMPLHCSVDLDQHSERIGTIRTKFNNFGDGLPEPKFIDTLSKIFYFGLHDLREITQPGWKNLGTWAPQLTLTREDADWIIDDILQIGLPFLDRFRVFTVDDADKFYNERNEFTDNLFRETGGSLGNIECATIYARLSGKRDFEAVVHHFEQFMDKARKVHEKYFGCEKEYAQVVDVCRNHLQPVDGSEPA
jgi:hypothetical protein